MVYTSYFKSCNDERSIEDRLFHYRGEKRRSDIISDFSRGEPRRAHPRKKNWLKFGPFEPIDENRRLKNRYAKFSDPEAQWSTSIWSTLIGGTVRATENETDSEVSITKSHVVPPSQEVDSGEEASVCQMPRNKNEFNPSDRLSQFVLKSKTRLTERVYSDPALSMTARRDFPPEALEEVKGFILFQLSGFLNTIAQGAAAMREKAVYLSNEEGFFDSIGAGILARIPVEIKFQYAFLERLNRELTEYVKNNCFGGDFWHVVANSTGLFIQIFDNYEVVLPIRERTSEVYEFEFE